MALAPPSPPKYTVDGKLKALASILNLKGVPDMATEINKFSANVRIAQAKRNRAVHDLWVGTGQDAMQLVITADRKLHFEMEPRDIQQLKDDHKVVESKVSEFLDIHTKIKSLQPSLPYTRPLVIQTTFQTHYPTETLTTALQK